MVQLPDIIKPEYEHSESLKAHAPGAYRPFSAKRLCDLWPENTGPAEFKPCPLPKNFDLDAGFCVWEVSGPNSDI